MVENERRRLLKLMIAAGFLAEAGAASGVSPLTPEILEKAMVLFEGDLGRESLEAVLPAVQRNVDFFRLVRELDIEDRVEPAPVFHASRSFLERSGR
jgi:hypothetical protein